METKWNNKQGNRDVTNAFRLMGETQRRGDVGDGGGLRGQSPMPFG